MVMKKYAYLFFVLFFLGAAAFIVLRYEKKNTVVAFYPLLERKGSQEQSAEWMQIKNTGDQLIRVVRDRPDDLKNRIALATLYIQEARITGNYIYYDGAALRYINEVLQTDPNHYEALTLKSLLFLSQHHFSDGLELAEKAQRSNPYHAFTYGLLVDAQVELGHYEKAVEASDKMVSIRPDIRSYSRISYLREIYGDYPGAISAMKLAVSAGGYADEATEWARIQLARLYELTGDRDAAAKQYATALQERPSYAYALAGEAHLALMRGNTNESIRLYQQADSLVTDYAIKEQLAIVYRETGDSKKAKALWQEVIDGMNKDAASGSDDENIGHYADRELALAYLETGNTDKALEHALAEYNRRPDNMDVNETLAWVYYKRNDFEKAYPLIAKALRTGSQNPVLLAHASLIYFKKDPVLAQQLAEKALMNHPLIDQSLERQLRALWNLTPSAPLKEQPLLSVVSSAKPY
jgi:tetratricopeptide (TPR) repeat protein